MGQINPSRDAASDAVNDAATQGQSQQAGASQSFELEPASAADDAAQADMAMEDAQASAANIEQQQAMAEIEKLESQFKSGPNWMLAIAAFTVINIVLIHLGLDFVFFLGLSFNAMIDVMGHTLAVDPEFDMPIIKYVALGVSVFTLLCWGLLGFAAINRYSWMMLAGVIAYGADTLITVGVLVLDPSNFLWLLIHAVAGYYMVRGWLALRKLNALDREVAMQPSEAADGLVDQPQTFA